MVIIIFKIENKKTKYACAYQTKEFTKTLVGLADKKLDVF